jgi:hypothetical protein
MPRVTPPGPILNLRRVSQLAPRAIAWLWPGRLALGKPALLEGDPGLGKSLLTLDLCARLSRGEPFPDGSSGPGPANAVVLNGEDNAEDTIRPRLQAMGADLDRVYVPDTAGHADALLCLPKQTDTLEKWLQEKQPKLLVIDPLVAFLDRRVNIGNDASVRRALYPLARLAEQYACAMLLVRHLNKRAGLRSLYRGGGSIGFVGASRSSWLVARDPEQGEQRVLAQVKNNLGPEQPSLAFTLAPPTEGGMALLSWLGPCAWTADQLVGSRAAALARPRDLAAQFLKETLANGPMTSRDIWNLAEKEGFTKRTLRRAKIAARVRSERVWSDPRGPSYWPSYWLMPGQELPESIKPKPREGDTVERWLQMLREQYPSASPIDDL